MAKKTIDINPIIERVLLLFSSRVVGFIDLSSVHHFKSVFLLLE